MDLNLIVSEPKIAEYVDSVDEFNRQRTAAEIAEIIAERYFSGI